MYVILYAFLVLVLHSINKRELLNTLIHYNTYIGKNFTIVKNNKTDAENGKQLHS